MAFAHVGHSVRVLDQDPMRIQSLRAKMDPLGEPHFADLLGALEIEFTTSPSAAYIGAEAAVIATSTPQSPTGAADLKNVFAAAEAIAEHAPSCLLLVKSTVPVGTADALQRGIARRFAVVSNPEFLREGHAIADSLCPDRIVAGGTPDAESAVLNLYEPIIAQRYAAFGAVSPSARRRPFYWMERRSAELTKYAANAFLATKLSFVNEMANVAAALGADIRLVLQALAADPRIGSSYLRPGIGWGGSCFPKDTRALSSFALESGYDFRVLRAVIEQNNDQVRRFFEMIRDALEHIDDVKIALLGLSFKAGTADCRESPALAVARLIQDQGWALTAFDPSIPKGSPEAPDGIAIASSAEDAVANADAIVIGTEWPQFQDLDFETLRKLTRGSLLFDGRCIIEPRVATAAGFQYRGICAVSDQVPD